jgi:uncharacterized protein
MILNLILPVFNCHLCKSVKNSAVTAILFLSLVLPATAYEQAQILSLRPSGAINDFAGIISPNVKVELENICTALFNNTGAAVVVATTISLNGNDIESVSEALFKKWGIGTRDKDEGILVLISVSDRMIRIETGYGSEGYVTDAHASRIIRESAGPYLTMGKWEEGVLETVRSLVALIEKEKAGTADGAAAIRKTASSEKVPVIPAILVFIIFVIMISTRTGRGILLYMLISSMASSGRSSGRGFGGGFGGGGFGGFGGGRSGGGGASGRF